MYHQDSGDACIQDVFHLGEHQCLLFTLRSAKLDRLKLEASDNHSDTSVSRFLVCGAKSRAAERTNSCRSEAVLSESEVNMKNLLKTEYLRESAAVVVDTIPNDLCGGIILRNRD
jgi:hypothetical protein